MVSTKAQITLSDKELQIAKKENKQTELQFVSQEHCDLLVPSLRLEIKSLNDVRFGTKIGANLAIFICS